MTFTSPDTTAQCLTPNAQHQPWLNGNRWAEKVVDDGYVLAATQRYGVGEIAGKILCQKQVPLAEIPAYLAPTLRDLVPDPMQLRGMAAAVTRLAQAVQGGEVIGVFGDYDVDGATSSAILLRYLQACGVKTAVHIPDRQKEGYGPNLYGFGKLREQGAALIVTVDTGALAHQVLGEAAEDGFEVIVLDHHKGEPELPRAVAVVNPNRFDETTEYTYLAAVGVTFLTLIALHRALREAGFFSTSPRAEPDLMSLLDIVALGTVCDVVPLIGLNRALVTQGLKILGQRRNIGLNALLEVAGVNEAPNPYTLGFLLGPRINAGGRVGEADLGVRLLSCENPIEAQAMAAQLDQYNQERRAIEAQVQEEATAQAEAQLAENPDCPMIIAAGAHWHEGVIGIAAGRIKERFDRPTAVIALHEDGSGKASARSVNGVDLGQMVINARQQGLLIAGGGHAMAAGFSVSAEKRAAFTEFARQSLAAGVARYRQESTRHYAAALPVTAASLELCDAIEQLGPFGAGNSGPRFCFPNVQILRAETMGKEGSHLRLIVAEPRDGLMPNRSGLKVISFGSVASEMGQTLLAAHGRKVSLIGRIKAESWQGRRSVSLMLEDARLESA